MLFFFGLITGFCVCVLLCTLLILFRDQTETVLKKYERKIETYSPKQKGFIVEAESDEEETRNDIIRKNQEKGLDTYISELL